MNNPEQNIITESDRWLGIYDDLDFKEYQRAPGINNSGLKVFHESPASYITEKHHPKPGTRALLIGHALHCLVFEPEKFSKQYIQSKYTEFRTAEAKAWRLAAEQAGMFVLKTDNDAEDKFWNPPEWDMIHRMTESLQRDPVASLLIAGSVFERSMFWIDKGFYIDGEKDPGTGRLCKCRLDGYNSDHAMIVDLKSADDASFSAFMRSVNDFSYFRQDPFYKWGALECGLDVSKGFVFIVIEKHPPWQVQIYRLTNNWIGMGLQMTRFDLDHYSACKKFNVWPGYGDRVIEEPDNPLGYSVRQHGVRDLNMQSWHHRQPVY